MSRRALGLVSLSLALTGCSFIGRATLMPTVDAMGPPGWMWRGRSTRRSRCSTSGYPKWMAMRSHASFAPSISAAVEARD